MAMESIITGRKFQINPTLLHRFFEEKVIETPEAVALIYEDEEHCHQVTFQDLNHASNKIANKILQIISQNKLKANEDGDWIVAICMKPSIGMVTAMLGIWKSGAGYLPLDDSFPAPRMNQLLEEAKPTMVIFDEDFDRPEIFEQQRAFHFIELFKDVQNFSLLNLVDQKTVTKGVKNMALFMYTPGTGGHPKFVRLSHLAAQNRIQWQWREFPFTETETHCAFVSSVTFINHFGEIWSPLLAGKTVVILPKFLVLIAEKVVMVLEQHKIQRLSVFPSFLRGIISFLSSLDDNNENPRLSELRLLISTGEELKVSLAKDIFKYFNQVVVANFYGATEVMGDVLTYKIESQEQLQALEKIPIGKPTHNTRIYILNEDRKPVKMGECGEIFISGAMLADGYVNGRDGHVFSRNTLTLVPLFWYIYQTGDFGYMKDGETYFESRHDMQVKVQGHRVEMEDIENFIDEIQFLEKAIVHVYRRGEENQKIVAFMKLKDAYAFMTISDITVDIRKSLPSYMVPFVIVINQFPYLPSGKIDQDKLISDHIDLIEGTQQQREIEMVFTDVPDELLDKAKMVFNIIGEVIGSELRGPISIHSNFFAIGGTSMNTLICVSNLRDENFDISIADFMSANNIKDILNKIAAPPSARASKIEIELPEDLEIRWETIKPEQKAECIELLATAFLEKGDLDQYIPDLQHDHFVSFLTPNWDFFVEKGLSFRIMDKTGKTLGVSLNYELGEVPEKASSSPLDTLFEYLGFVETDILANRVPDEKVLEAFMMGTAKSLNSAENIHAISFMEKQILKIAKSHNFHAVIATNTNQLNQQIAERILGYKTLKEFQVNQYIDQVGKRPFETAKDFHKTVTVWKEVIDE